MAGKRAATARTPGITSGGGRLLTIARVAAAPEPYTPLLKWTRPLTADERAHEREHSIAMWKANFDIVAAFQVPPPFVREDRAGRLPNAINMGGWLPMLPADTTDCCPWCALPSTSAKLCQGCKILQKAFGTPIRSLEFLCCADVATAPETLIYTWKLEAPLHDHEVFGPSCASFAESIAAPLSAYLEEHEGRILGGHPVMTAVPSRAPLIATTMARARDLGWFTYDVHASGVKHGSWAQHTAADQSERRSRTELDWEVDTEVVRDRDVVLVDDVFVTGTSLFSYATALKTAGARSVRAVVIVRHIAGRSPHYYDALRIAKRTHELRWTARRCRVAEIAS